MINSLVIRIMDIVHCAHEGMQFCAHLTTLLGLLLQPIQDMIKCKMALPKRSDVPAAQVLLKLVLVLLGTSGYLGVLVGKVTHDAGGDFVMDNCLVIFAYDIDPELLLDLSDKHTGGRLGYGQLCHLIFRFVGSTLPVKSEQNIPTTKWAS